MERKRKFHLRRPATGFTLVEMVVVMLILSVLTTLAVNVSDDVRRNSRGADTRQIQGVVEAAVRQYHQAQNQTLPSGDFGPDSGADLLAALQRCGQSKEALQALPSHATERDAKTGRQRLLDGFGKPMRYHHRPNEIPPRTPLLSSQGDDPAEKSDDILLELFLETSSPDKDSL